MLWENTPLKSFELVAGLLCDKEGVKVLTEALQVQTEALQVHKRLQDTYWICAFAVNQHAGICGANPDGDIDPITNIPHPAGWWFGTFFPYIGNNHPN